MRRRDFVALFGGVALAPLAASAQEAKRDYRLGVLHQLPRAAPQFAHLVDELRRQGFIEGHNLAVDPRGFGSRSHQYRERAAELVKSGVDVLFCGGDETLRAAQQVTRTIPIVGVADDMVASGLVTSLNVLSSVMLNAVRQVIFDQAAALRIPAIYQFPESAEQGGFIGYGLRIEQIYRHMAVVVARLFRGERAQDLPVQQPTTFELVINLTIGKALGLMIPETLLIRADKVIE